MPVEVGNVLEGVVTGIANFGAFVQLPGGETGLVHISEVADEYVKDINQFLKVNDRITVKVISVDARGKIGLSIRQARDPGERPFRRRRFEPSFEEKLSRFLKESEEVQQSLRRSLDAKRGGRGSGRRFF
ncbi:S1 RNA-binding domain-containing protein [Desulfofundulus thermocisternus]|uniref:S1 RNA-binding domain-containing protein n=1 Tax=Desulfofundulus thermocisternus TaxID=42471 RepID=UPI0019E79452|nr:S1 RNA-binding domain-containing protein [Desulfofundulus thermocisternus]MBE3585850.1 S1 RNA-binding domain-containing protein [Thermoanaerobacter sp.]MCS5696450.1 S1 RNA-binding domain-containing protein [Desulfofundulus thermocisternus]